MLPSAVPQVATQALFVCATRNVSLITSGNQQQPVHVYHYDHLMNFGKFIWGTNFSICDTEVRAHVRVVECPRLVADRSRCRCLVCMRLFDVQVCHGAELVPVFHPKVTPFNQSYTPAEEVMSASIDTFWTNVAKTGSPGTFSTCPPPLASCGLGGTGAVAHTLPSCVAFADGIDFKAFNAADQYTMLIETPTDMLMSKEFEDECAFWTQLDWWAKHVGRK